MMRILGAGLVLAATVGGFGSLRVALHRRERELASWQAAVRLMSREITYGMLPLPRVCENLGRECDGVAGKFFTAMAENLRQNGGNLAECWGRVLQEQGDSWHMLAADMAVLSDLGQGLGQSNLSGQRRLLAVVEERLVALGEESGARYARLSRLLSGLGWCGGLLLICWWL